IVRTMADVPALGRREPFELCVAVDRDTSAIVRVEPTVVRAGERARVRVVSARSAAKTAGAWSVLATADQGTQAASLWLPDGERGGALALPAAASGIWTVSAASPGAGRKARIVGGTMLVVPRILPAIRAKVVGGRAAPGGSVDIEADLGDGHGQGLPGTVSAL